MWRDYQDPADRGTPEQPFWSRALWFLVKLGLVIGLIFLSLGAYKRFLGAQAASALGARVRVLESTRLAGTQSLFLVSAGERAILVGSNGAGLLVKLAEWPADAALPEQGEAAFARQIAQATARSDDFQGVIDSSLRQARVPPKGIE